eukprot:1717463-Pyramimonas_sp.AAC.1
MRGRRVDLVVSSSHSPQNNALPRLRRADPLPSTRQRPRPAGGCASCSKGLAQAQVLANGADPCLSRSPLRSFDAGYRTVP